MPNGRLSNLVRIATKNNKVARNENGLYSLGGHPLVCDSLLAVLATGEASNHYGYEVGMLTWIGVETIAGVGIGCWIWDELWLVETRAVLK